MKKITGILFAWIVATWVHIYVSNSVVANTTNDVNWLITGTSDIKKLDYWLAEIQKKFPDAKNNEELMLTITDIEDSIQMLDSPAREEGMALIEKQYKENPSPDIQEFQKNLDSLTEEEKNKLNELLFKQSQKHLAELLLFLSKNLPQEINQCEKPKLII